MNTITAMSIYGVEDSLVASRFHIRGCRTAAKYDLSRVERYKKLKNAIDGDWRMVYFVRKHVSPFFTTLTLKWKKMIQGIQRDEFIDDWLNMAEDIEENLKKLQLNGPTTMGNLCLTAFCEKFRDGDQEAKTRLLLAALDGTPDEDSCQ